MKNFFVALALWAAGAFLPAMAADKSAPLTLETAVRLALDSDDPSARRFKEQALALEDRAVADSQLADPELILTMQNMPTSFDYTQENMTQFKTALRQRVPAGRTLELRGERRRAERRAALAAAELRELEIARQTRLAWLEQFYWLQAGESIAESRRAVAELEEAVSADYAAGRASSQELMRTRLEISLLDDRIIEADRQLELARADLARWTGAAAARRELPKHLPALKHPEPLEGLRDMLTGHPASRQADFAVDARSREIEVAEQQYLPDWGVEVGYGVRGGNRDDFVTAGVTLDIPLFTDKRQDRAVSASKRERNAARLSRQALLLDMRLELERDHAAWRRLGQRVQLYETAVLERAAETTTASRTAYRSGVTDFAELIRARLAELEAELTLSRLRVEQAQMQVRLLFLEGDL